MESMELMSVKEVAKEHKKRENTIQKDLQSGKLIGEKDKNNQWWVVRQSAMDSYKFFSSNEWMLLTDVSRNFNISMEELDGDVLEGILDVTWHDGKRYVHYSDLKRYIESKNQTFLYDPDKVSFDYFVILNSRGVHMRPMISMCDLGKRNPKTGIYLEANGQTWHYTKKGAGMRLLEMGIQKGTQVKALTSGVSHKEVLTEILEMAANRFKVEN